MGPGSMPQQQFMGQPMFMPQIHPQMGMGGPGMMPYPGGFPMMAGQPGGQLGQFGGQAATPGQRTHTGPQTSIKELCEITNLPVLFKTQERSYCEKCFTEKAREMMQQNKKGAQLQESVQAAGEDDLLSRLKEPAKPFQGPNMEDD